MPVCLNTDTQLIGTGAYTIRVGESPLMFSRVVEWLSSGRFYVDHGERKTNWKLSGRFIDGPITATLEGPRELQKLRLTVVKGAFKDCFFEHEVGYDQTEPSTFIEITGTQMRVSTYPGNLDELMSSTLIAKL